MYLPTYSGQKTWLESIIKTVMNEIVDAQQESDRMYIKLEEKIMNFKAEQRSQEQEFQISMMTVLFRVHSSHTSPAPRPTYDPYGQFHGY